MSYRREVRAEGSTLILGGVRYRIDSVEGMGGSSIVYRASYEDSLNTEEKHFVLIKELFPVNFRGDIRRGGDGGIICTGEGKESMDFYRLRFKQGNQANLELLAKKPSQTSGNLNSYEAYGTYYSVLTLHGGQNLEELLEQGRILSLKEMAEILIKILDALDCFHQNGFLHLDISPDNILLLKEGALLIDYNSVWSLNGDEREFSISEKKGYSAPEVCLRNLDEIGVSSDIYSVCGIFFRMLAGRTLSEDEIIGNGLRKYFAEGLPAMEKEPRSASCKAMQILARGLHTLARRRYQSVGEMRLDVEEMIDRIDHRGVSAATLWENSSLAYKKSTIRKEGFLPRQFSLEGKAGEGLSGDGYGTDYLWEALLNGAAVLIEGPGGMGKTTLFGELWGRGVRTWSKRTPIVIYIPLKERQTREDEADYIRRAMIRGLGFRNEKEREEDSDSLRELEKLLDQKQGEKQPIILLLDGLNEAGTPREKLLREIELLAAKPGVGVLVSDRTDDVMEYALKSFTAVRLLPLEKEVVEKQLSRYGCVSESKESADELLKLLSNPMMLNLYLQIFAMEKENNLSAEPMKRIQSADELVGVFLEQLCLKQLRLDSGNQGLQLCHKYILHHLLPQIAREMGRKKRTLLSFDEIYQVTAENFRRLRDDDFGKSFPEYLGKSRLMLAKTTNEAEWFDFAVSEQLMGTLGLIVRNEDGSYSLIHDNFQGYLSEQYFHEGTAYDRHKKQKKAVKISAFVLLTMLVLCGMGLLMHRAIVNPVSPGGTEQDAFSDGTDDISQDDIGQMSATGTAYTEEEQKTINRVVVSIQSNLGTLSSYITAQRTVLEDAGKQELLNADEQAMEDLKELIAFEINYMEHYTILSPDENLLEELVAINPEFPISEIQSLCGRASEMKAVMTQCLGELEEMLCDPDGIYTEYSDREEIVTVYEKYLDAYVQYVYFEFDYVLLYLDGDNVYEILNGNQYTDIFRDYYLATGNIKQDVDTLQAAMKTAKNELKDAQDAMIENHYKMIAADWK